MHTILHLLRWFAPGLVIPVSYLSLRYVPGRRGRLWLYFVILVVLVVVDLNRISFTSELADIVIRQFVLFMIAEFLWLVSLRPTRPALIVALLAVAGLWVGWNRSWLAQGPMHVSSLWRVREVSSHRSAGMIYVVKEHDRTHRPYPHRVFTLTRRRPGLPFEQTGKSYRTPEGFSRSDFTFLWGPTLEGLRVDLRADGHTLWTLGDGL